jgi:hypothetical protein
MSLVQQFRILKDQSDAELQVDQITDANLLRGDADMQLEEHQEEFAGADLSIRIIGYSYMWDATSWR